jgi:hypothetical protein
MSSTILDKLKEGRRVAKMRLGQSAPSYVTLPSNPEVRFAIVPLIEREYQLCLESVAGMDIPDNAYGVELRDRQLQLHTLWMALRDPDNPENKVFASVEAMLDEQLGLEPTDVNHLIEMYQREIDFSSPALEGLTEEQVEELKKALLKIDWNALSGKPYWHLRQFLLTLPVGVPLDKSPWLTSTLKSIGMNVEEPFTPGASEN